MRKITTEIIEAYKNNLVSEEKSQSTIDKYIRDVREFSNWLGDVDFDKSEVLAYKARLSNDHAAASVNTVISSLNSFFNFNEWYELKVKTIKIQRQIFSSKDKELTKAEYERLLTAANDKKNQRLYYLIQTIASTGIRVSELRYITTSAVHSGQAVINCKGKMRIVILPKELCKMLKGYIRENNIKNGSVFVSRTGNPLDRSHIWKMLKALCETAEVSKDKVFPHNFRHLFARTYYSLQKDIVRLADILGHSSVNTTRIYTMSTGEVHRKQLQRLGLLRC
jgi:site-specific recombinase XerD